MKEKIKEYKLNSTVISVASIVLGVVFLLSPTKVLKVVGYLIGVALLAMGAVAVVTYLKRDVTDNFMKNDFLRGLVEITLAVCTFIKVKLVIDILPIVLGIAIIISGCKKLQETIDMYKAKSQSWLLILILAAINITIGILVVCNPFKTMTVITIVTGAGLIYGGVMDFLISRHVAKQMDGVGSSSSDNDSNIIDM